MQLDRVTIALRTREPWEAVDLGAAMIRAWWRPVYGAWCATVMPLALGLAVLAWFHPTLAIVLLWWLKPLYDRIVLHVLSQAVFGTPPSVMQTVARLPTLVRATGLAGALTLRRFDPIRSFNLPVRQLEQQHGRHARERERLLGRRAAGQATGLLYACLGFELIVFLGLNVCVDLVRPAGLPGTLGAESLLRELIGWNDSGESALARFAFIVAALSVVEPLYVAGGFALYLNRRTTLEAWDLELAFRRMAVANTDRTRLLLPALAWWALVASLLAPMPQAAWAAPAQTDAKQIIRDVLASPEFAEYKTVEAWRPKHAEQNTRESERTWMSTLVDVLRSFAEALAELGRVAGYVGLAAVLFFVVRLLVKSRRGGRSDEPPRGTTSPPPETLFGLDVRPESLPAELAELAAHAAVRDPRLALSLLYRGALATLMHRDRMAIRVGDTEGDCVRRVEQLPDPALAAYFRRLVDVWSGTAYGSKIAEPATVQALCADWPRYFTPPAGSSA